MNNLKEKITRMPGTSGVYLMRNKTGAVLYVGKAKSLKKRLMSYIGAGISGKTEALMSNVTDIEYRLTPNETMAFLLEARLIQQYKPKYNISLRDDKSFPMVKITNEEFPLICVTRKKEDDGAKYLGPYTNAKLLRHALRVIRRSFPYRSCKKLPKKPCIYWRLKLSPAPCIGKISKKEYARIIRDITLILEGRTDTLIKQLSKEMDSASSRLKFEEAAKARDRINALSLFNLGRLDTNVKDGLEDLKVLLRLGKLPLRIEAFDISNITGKEATGSMVSFYRGIEDKNNYRRFRIKTVSGINDYGMLKEVIRRRYSRLIAENRPLPDLILIDGGRAHLLAAEKELEALDLDMDLASIAKEEENIYTKGRQEPIKLLEDTPALNLIRRLRDEAHRFAVAYHHILHRKKIIGR